MEEKPNPYQAPSAVASSRPLWRRFASGLIFTFATLVAALAILMTFAGTNWLMIEKRNGPQLMPPTMGIDFHVYQALYIGAGLSALAAVACWWIGKLIRG